MFYRAWKLFWVAYCTWSHLNSSRWQHEIIVIWQETNCPLFRQQRERQFTSVTHKQARSTSTGRFVYGALCVLSLRPTPLPPLCFLEGLEWVLCEKAHLKKDLRDPWLAPTAAQLCSLLLTPITTPPISTTHQSLDIAVEMCATAPAATVQL